MEAEDYWGPLVLHISGQQPRLSACRRTAPLPPVPRLSRMRGQSCTHDCQDPSTDSQQIPKINPLLWEEEVQESPSQASLGIPGLLFNGY